MKLYLELKYQCRAVDHGIPVNDVDEFLNAVRTTSVILFHVTYEDIKRMQKRIPPAVKPVKGTLKFHQFQIVQKEHISVRNFSFVTSLLHVSVSMLVTSTSQNPLLEERNNKNDSILQPGLLVDDELVIGK